MDEKRSGFLGTYFDKTTVLGISRAARILAWVVLAYSAVDLLLSGGVLALQIARGFWAGMGPTDVLSNIFQIFQQPLHGVVYFFALLGVSQLLLIFLDIEDNTRRAARR